MLPVKAEEFRRVLIALDMSSEEPRIVVGNLSEHGGLEYLRELREPDPHTLWSSLEARR